MQVTRCEYVIKTNVPKKNGENVTSVDLINIGYMAGRFGVDLNGNLEANYVPKVLQEGVVINVNSCTTSLLEDNLSQSGISFDRIV